MLPPEIEEGNKEYKRYFKEVSKKRFFELTTQMNWRLIEGNGVAYYYLGVNDDGTIYGKLDNITFKYSINIIKKIANDCEAKITNLKQNIVKDLKWFKIEITKNNAQKFKEYRILLLGDTNTGKSTFLANIIKRKTNKNNDANSYIYNHKHELESGNTSSIKYYTLIDKNKKYLFFDSPGNNKYIKTLLKVIQSIDYNLVLYFPNKNNNWEYKDLFMNYFDIINVPILFFDINSEITMFPKVNLNELVNINNFNKYIYHNCIEINNTDDVQINILNTCYNNEIGWLLSGYLKSGEIKVNDILYLYDNDIKTVKVKSIYCSNTEDTNISCKKVNGPQIITICCSIKDGEKINIKYGILSKTLCTLSKNIKIKWNRDINSNVINCNILNKKVTLEKKDVNNYLIVNKKIVNNLQNNIIINYTDKNIGFLV